MKLGGGWVIDLDRLLGTWSGTYGVFWTDGCETE